MEMQLISIIDDWHKNAIAWIGKEIERQLIIIILNIGAQI
jgi:hypothetical protein